MRAQAFRKLVALVVISGGKLVRFWQSVQVLVRSTAADVSNNAGKLVSPVQLPNIEPIFVTAEVSNNVKLVKLVQFAKKFSRLTFAVVLSVMPGKLLRLVHP